MKLALVVVYRGRRRVAYAHNLPADEASRQVTQLHSKSVSAYVLPQAQSHGANVEECQACLRNIKRAMKGGDAPARALRAEAAAQIATGSLSRIVALEQEALREAVQTVAHVEGMSLRKARAAVLAVSLEKTAPQADNDPDANFAYGYWMGVRDARQAAGSAKEPDCLCRSESEHCPRFVVEGSGEELHILACPTCGDTYIGALPRKPCTDCTSILEGQRKQGRAGA